MRTLMHLQSGIISVHVINHERPARFKGNPNIHPISEILMEQVYRRAVERGHFIKIHKSLAY